MSRVRRRSHWAALILLAACVPGRVPRVAAGAVELRVALATAARQGTVSGSGAWRFEDAADGSLIARVAAGESWTVSLNEKRVRLVRPDGTPVAERASLVVRSEDLSLWNGRRYRGVLALVATDSGLLVVNRVALEDYLRGVVPLEIGDRARSEMAAVEAQAVAARSFAMARRAASGARPYDLVATVTDQHYGGADAERPVSSEAVSRTAGLVLRFGGRVVLAPYHSSCGGSTAEPDEVWSEGVAAPYLRRVSDRIPGTDRNWCDVAPAARWTRTFDQSELARLLGRGRGAPPGGVTARAGRVRSVAVAGTTPSGRVGSLAIETEQGRYELRGNDIRFALPSRGGEILPSTYFSLETRSGTDGTLAGITLHGRGNGHGVGMCQWGAIGRARAGLDFRAILQAYYPGTSIDALD